VTSGEIFPIVLAETPALDRSPTELYGRPAIILRAVTAPTPGRASSSFWLARFRSTRLEEDEELPPGAARELGEAFVRDSGASTLGRGSRTGAGAEAAASRSTSSTAGLSAGAFATLRLWNST